MKTKSLIGIGFLMACMVCPAVFAQEEAPKAELFGGFSIMNFEDADCNYHPKGKVGGWAASFAANLNPEFAVKADFSGLYSSGKNPDGTRVEGSRITQYNILGGVQYTKRYENINVFGEALGGFVKVDEKITAYHSHAYNGYGMAFGGGVDWKFNPKIAWRIAQVDYMPAHWNEKFHHNIRYQTGVLLSLGK